MSGKTKKKAALDAGYAATTAANTKGKIESKPEVEALFKKLLETAGVSDELLAERVYEGLNATVVVRESLYAKREVLIDFAERREMVELAIRMKGLMPAEQHSVKVTLEDLLDESQG